MTNAIDAPGAHKSGGWIAYCKTALSDDAKIRRATMPATQKEPVRDAASGR